MAAAASPTLLVLLLLLLHNFPSSPSAASPTARRLLAADDQDVQYFPDAAVSAGPPVPILDIEGKTVKAGGSYYIIPANTTTHAGGVGMSSLSATSTCPLSVIQDRHADSNGSPLSFLPVATKLGYIVRTSTDLNIEFTTTDACEEGGVWKVEEYDDDVEQWFVGTGGVEGKPGARTVEDWFKIVKYGVNNYNYKLVHCPGVCKSCKIKCKDVGVFVDENGVRRLALTEDRPFVVKFMRADI
ncbi:unnamed protein product [Linum tenue]|uniref:Uncharacterized protein n=1 Tax=Linum tenue TaxID=586396 RepID=A0AAV0RHW8_9ROSI|nr:unnamed protein product [Linum tenue]